MTKASSTAIPNPVNWSGSRSKLNGWWMIASVSGCMSVSLGREARQGKGGVGVEVETRKLAALEAEQARTADHRRIVGREPGRRGEDGGTGHRCPLPGRRHERAVARNTAAEHDAPPPMRARGAKRLLAQRLDERILERSREIGAIAVVERAAIGRQ